MKERECKEQLLFVERRRLDRDPSCWKENENLIQCNRQTMSSPRRSPDYRNMEVRPYSGGSFKKLGTEEAHTVETYERKIHGTPDMEPQRQFSSKQFTERRTYGRDENGEIVVKIETDPEEPVRPATPVRPVSPVGDHNNSHLLKPIQPLTIPRIDIKKATPSPRSPRSLYYGDDLSPQSYQRTASPRSNRSGAVSPRSNASSTGSANIPMKKVTTKKRLVSIHDGRPVSPFVETVTYEPAFPDRHSSSSHRSSPRPISRGSGYSNSSRRNQGSPSECAYIVENPLYRD